MWKALNACDVKFSILFSFLTMSLWPVQNHSIKFIIMYVLSCFLLMFLQFSSRMCFLDSSWAIFEKSPSPGLSFVLLLRDAIFPSTVYDKLSFSLSRVGALHQAVYFPFPFLFHGLSGICLYARTVMLVTLPKLFFLYHFDYYCFSRVHIKLKMDFTKCLSNSDKNFPYALHHFQLFYIYQRDLTSAIVSSRKKPSAGYINEI